MSGATICDSRILTLLQRYPPTNLTALLNSPRRPGDACLPKVPRALSCKEGPLHTQRAALGSVLEDPGAGALPAQGTSPCLPGAPLLVSDPEGPEAGCTHSSPSPCPSAPFAGAPAPNTPRPGPCAPGSGRPPCTQQSQRASPTSHRGFSPPRSGLRGGCFCPASPGSAPCPLQTVHPSPPLPRPPVPGPEPSGPALQETNLTGCLSGVTPASTVPGTFSSISGRASCPACLTPDHYCVPLSGSGRLVP